MLMALRDVWIRFPPQSFRKRPGSRRTAPAIRNALLVSFVGGA